VALPIPGATPISKMLHNNSTCHHKMNGNGKELNFGYNEAIGTVCITLGSELKFQEQLYSTLMFHQMYTVRLTLVLLSKYVCVSTWKDSNVFRTNRKKIQMSKPKDPSEYRLPDLPVANPLKEK
jgi:hypothetical protein